MARWKDRIFWTVATCCGLGYSPILPGTCGALWGIPIYLAIVHFAALRWHTPLLALAVAITVGVTIALSDWAEHYFDEKDSGKFVTDEVAGFLITVLLFRVADSWVTVYWAFPATRVIDIVKIPPAKRLEHLPGGWGVMADDVLGSFYAAGLLHVLAWQWPGWFGIGS